MPRTLSSLLPQARFQATRYPPFFVTSHHARRHVSYTYQFVPEAPLEG
jgi:hypothetical protein